MKFSEYLGHRVPSREILTGHLSGLRRLARIGESVGVVIRHNWSHRYRPRGPARDLVRYDGDCSYPSTSPQNRGAIPPDFYKLFVVNNRSKDNRVVAIPVGTQPQRNPWRLALAPLFVIRRELAYCNFSVESRTNPAYTVERRKVFDAIRHHKWITFENMGNSYGAYDLGLFKYYRRVSQHRFTISPQGGGIDCHRTWEALYLKSIPIVQRSPEMEHFSDLPILFSDDYSELTPDYLEEQYARMLATDYNVEKLYLSYWRRKIEDAIAEFDA